MKEQEFLENTLKLIQDDFYTRDSYYRWKQEVLIHPNNYDIGLFAILDNILFGSDKDKFIKTIEPDTVLYRARIIFPQDYPANRESDNGIRMEKDENDIWHTHGFDENNSIEPAFTIAANGRNNYSGSSYLYVAEEPATACAEIKCPLYSLISLADFIVKEPIRIMDFANEKVFEQDYKQKYGLNPGIFFTLLMADFMLPVHDNSGYLFTQIVSDYIRKSGIDGLSYRSSFSLKTNYTIFNSHRAKIRFKTSRIVRYMYSSQIYWDLEGQKELTASSTPKDAVTKVNAEKWLKDLVR